jgi:hypothetical protein
VISAPSGAKIYVDGVDTTKVTPSTLSFPKQPAHKIAITLKLKGYTPYAFKPVDTAESSQQKVELVKLVKTGPGPAVPSTTGNKTGSGAKTGSAAQPKDPDGLMRPE